MALDSSPSRSGSASGAWPALVPQGHLKGRPPIPLKRVLTVVGAIKTAHIHLLSKQVSQVHAVLIYSNGGLYVRDVASRTHTFVNDKPVREADLHNGDKLKVGEFSFQVRLTTELDDSAAPAPDAMLQIDGEDLPLMLSGRTTVIGRRSTCDLPVANEALSTVHAIVFECNGMRMVRDFNSRAGTFVNGQKVHQTELNIGDEITAGPVAMRYLAAVAEEAAPVEEDQPLERHPIVLDTEAPPAAIEEPPPVPVTEGEAGADVGSALAEPVMSGDTTAGQEIPVEDTAVAQHVPPQPEDSVMAQELAPVPIEEVTAPPAELPPIPMDAEPAVDREEPTEAWARIRPARAIEPEAQTESEPATIPVDDEPVEPQSTSPAVLASDNYSAPAEPSIPMSDEAPASDEPLAVAPVASSEDEPAVPVALPEEIDLGEISIKDDDASGFSDAAEETEASEEPAESSDAMAALPIKGEVAAVEVPPLGPVEDLPPVAVASQAPPLSDEVEEVEEVKSRKETLPPPPKLEPEEDLPPLPAIDEQAPAAALDFSVPEIEFPALDLDTSVPTAAEIAPRGKPSAAEPAPPAFVAGTVEEALPELDFGAIDDTSLPLDLNVPSAELDLPELKLPKLDFEKEMTAAPSVAEADVAPPPTPPPTFSPTPPEPVIEPAAPVPVDVDEELPIALAPTLDVPEIVEPEDLAPVEEQVAIPVEEEKEDTGEIPVAERPEEAPPAEPEMAQETPAAVEEVIEAVEPQAMPDEEVAAADVEPQPQEMAAPSVETDDAPAISDEEATEFLEGLEEEQPQQAATGHVEEAPGPLATEIAPPAPVEIEQESPAVAEEPLVEEPVAEEPIAPAPEPEPEPIGKEAPPPIESPEAAPEIKEKPKRRWWPFGKRKDQAAPAQEAPSVEQLPPYLQEPQAVEERPAAEEPAAIPVDEEPSMTAADVLPPETQIEPPASAVEELGEQPSPEPTTVTPEIDPAAAEAPVDIDSLVDEALTAPPTVPEPAIPVALEQAPPIAEAPKPQPPAKDELTVPEGFATDQMMYLGGMPLDLNKPLAPEPPPPPQQQPVREQEPQQQQPPQQKQPPPPARPKPPMKLPPRPKLPSVNRASEDETFLPGLDSSFSTGPSVEAFQGLAMPPVRDVFSPLPKPAPNDPFLDSHSANRTAKPLPGSDEHDTNPTGQAGGATHRISEPIHTDDDDNGHAIGTNGDDFFSATPQKTDPNARRPISAVAPAIDVSQERKLPGVRVLLGFMLLLMFIASGLVWFLVPPHYRIEGTLKFRDFANLSTRQKESLRAEQRQLLGDPDVRKNAAQIVEAKNGMSPGFLGDPQSFGIALSAAEYTLWPSDDTSANADTLTFTLDSRSPSDDALRVKSLLTSLWLMPTNKTRIDRAAQVSDVKKLEEQADRLNTRIKALEVRADEQKRTIDSAPADSTYTAVQTVVGQRKQAWESAQAAVLETRAQLEQMKAASTQPVVAATQPQDPRLAELQSQLADARKKAMSIRSSSATGLAEARGTYDLAVSDFQKQTEEFQKKAKDIPELQAYANAASDLKDTARALADQLLRSQKDQREQLDRLIDLKNRMEEKLQARRLEIWNNDPEMRDLTQRLALASRKYNASSSAQPDRQQDLPALKKDVDDLKAKVADRQKTLGDDTFYAETIAQLDKDIATGQRHLQENAASAEDARARFEKNLQNMLPAGDKMTDEQKRLTAGLRKSLLEMDSARKQYVQALAPPNSSQETMATVQNAIMELQAQIDVRRQELEAARPKLSQDEQAKLLARNIDKKQAELTAAEKLADDAENALIKTQGQLTDMTNLRAAAKIATDTRDRYMGQIKDLEAERAGVTSRITVSTAEAHSIAYPEEPSMDNIRTIKGEDPRLKYTMASCGGIMLVFVLLIFISSQVSEVEEGPAALRPVSAMPQAAHHDPHEPLQV